MPATRISCGFALAAALFPAAPGPARAEAFAPGWTLDPEVSSLTFQSIKNGTVIETSKFAVFSGAIGGDGAAEVRIELESVDTGIDLRNVRMRFLFFESFRFPQATVSARLDALDLSALGASRQVTLPVQYAVDLHGVAKDLEIATSVALIADNIALVSADAVRIPVEDFALDEGLLKLEEAANVDIEPFGLVSFTLVFMKNGGPDQPAATGSVPAAAVEEPQAEKPQQVAVESSGAFSAEECAGRFEIISRAGAIYFRSGSADLDTASAPMLATVADIVSRCPSLSVLIAGHTDSAGAEDANQALSEARAAAVRDDLVLRGVEAARFQAVGFGESRPVASNDDERGRRLNRRIEFTISQAD